MARVSLSTSCVPQNTNDQSESALYGDVTNQRARYTVEKKDTKVEEKQLYVSSTLFF